MNSSNKFKKHAAAKKTSSDSHSENTEFQDILDNIIGEEYLIKVTGSKDLSKIKHLQIKINTNNQSILSIPDFLPNLQSLVLDYSILASIRDLGVDLRNLLSISLNHCSLSDLDGIGVLLGLQDLSLCDNFLIDLSPLSMHENIQTLNMSGNNLSDLSLCDSLSTCSNLRSLFLTRNPIAKAPNYRLIIASMISTLCKLDGLPVDANASSKVSTGMLLEAASAMHIVEEEIDDEKRMEMAISSTEDSSNQNPPSYMSSNNSLIPDTGSELTHGSSVVLAGNVAAAMRKRRGKTSSLSSNSPMSSSHRKSFEETQHTHTSSIATTETEELSTLDILDAAGIAGVRLFDSAPFLGEGDITETFLAQLQYDENGLSKPSSTSQHQTQHMTRPMSSMSPNMKRKNSQKGNLSLLISSTDSFAAELAPPSTGRHSKTTTMTTSNKSKSSQQQNISFENNIEGISKREFKLESHAATVSPRQHNSSSRPSTAVAMRLDKGNGNGSGSGSSNSKGLAVPSAPFKVSIDLELENCEGDLKTFRSRLASRKGSRSTSTSIDAIVDYSENATGGMNTHTNARVGNIHSFSNSNLSDDDSIDMTQFIMQRNINRGDGDNSSRGAERRSIVHLDIVRRNTVKEDFEDAAAARNNHHSYVQDIEDDDDEDDVINISSSGSEGEGEDIHINHASRHRLMSASNRHGRKPKKVLPFPSSSSSNSRVSSAGSSYNSSDDILLPVFYNRGEELRTVTVYPPPLYPRTKTQDKDKDKDKSVPASFITSKDTGRSVSSFEPENDRAEPDPIHLNLNYNHLHAHMHSSRPGSSNVTPRSDVCSLNGNGGGSSLGNPSHIHKETIASKAGKSLGFDLIGSLAAIDQWVDDMDPDSEEDGRGEMGGIMHTKLGDVSSRHETKSNAVSVVQNSWIHAGDSEKNMSHEKKEIISHPKPYSNITSSTNNGNDKMKDVINRDKDKDHSHQLKSKHKSSDSNKSSSNNYNIVDATASLSLANTGTGTSLNDVPEPVSRTETNINTSKNNYKLSSKGEIGNAKDLTALGNAISLSDKDLIEMLRKPPKLVPALRTKSSFQAFFQGVQTKRMRFLLEEAYANIEDEIERSEKVSKRMDLLKDTH